MIDSLDGGTWYNFDNFSERVILPCVLRPVRDLLQHHRLKLLIKKQNKLSLGLAAVLVFIAHGKKFLGWIANFTGHPVIWADVSLSSRHDIKHNNIMPRNCILVK